MDYVNLNNNISLIICEAWEEVIEIEKETFEMKIKEEINVPILLVLIFEWLEKKLVAISKTN